MKFKNAARHHIMIIELRYLNKKSLFDEQLKSEFNLRKDKKELLTFKTLIQIEIALVASSI